MFPSTKTIKLIFLYSFFCVFHDLVHAEIPYHSCSNTTISSNQFKYDPFHNLLRFLSSNASVSKSYKTSIRSGRETLHGIFLCYNYVPKSECQRCIAKAASDIQSLCPNANDAIVWEEECQLRYSNERFFGKLDVARNRIWQNSYNVSESDGRIKSAVKDLLHNLTKKAAFNASTGMYATEKTSFTRPDIEAISIYALVQCTADLSADDCNTCLKTAILNVSSGRNFPRGARILSPSCYLRYEFYDFYMQSQPTQNQSEMPKRKRSRRDKWMIVVLSTGSAILLVLGFCVYHIALRNRTKTRAGNIYSRDVQLFDMGDPNNEDFMHQNLHGRENLNHQEFPFFNLETLNQATNNFSDSNKLGQGGFGPVYKGTLPDGVEVAVKRLSINSEQGLDEFTNEVLLILKLQHKNLVKLLGFCVDREEKLLVYEYMPNGSLDVILFDPSKRVQLNWSRRLNIINGIVRGMLYLHEDSRLRIIHRDLKVSNVLLDKDMNSKISDFGMARIFKGSDGEANTAKIVGTFGYMAPEFAMEGLYSIKSDVFSFGVLLLEIITGRRNIGFHLSKRAPSLLAYTWQLWNEGKGLELIDPLLLDSCCFDEFLRHMHIGLLCVQEDAYDRPTMSSVMVMLKSKAVTLRQPERPAFSVGRFIDQCEVNENSFFPQ